MRNCTGSPGPLVPSLLTSQTLLCLWSSAQLRGETRGRKMSLLLPQGLLWDLEADLHHAQPHSNPFFSFLPFLEDVEGMENRKGPNTPRVISHFPQYLLGLPFLLLIIQGVPVRVDLRLLGVAVRYGVWLAWVLPPALRTWGKLFLWHLGGVSGRAVTGGIPQPGKGPG